MIVFSKLEQIARTQTKGAALLVSRRINHLFRIFLAGNKSGAILLTTARFTMRTAGSTATLCLSL